MIQKFKDTANKERKDLFFFSSRKSGTLKHARALKKRGIIANYNMLECSRIFWKQIKIRRGLWYLHPATWLEGAIFHREITYARFLLIDK